MNHRPPDDHRIPDDLLIPTIVSLMDGEEEEQEPQKKPDSPGCCGCLVVTGLFILGGLLFSWLL